MSRNEMNFENEQYRKIYWHTCSHILAQAVKRLYPKVKLAIGPAIENGFYYDMDADFGFNPEILEKIENEMRLICNEKLEAAEESIAKIVKDNGEVVEFNPTE